MNIRLTTELKAKLQRLADADGRKLSNYIERVLLAHVDGRKSVDPKGPENAPIRKRKE